MHRPALLLLALVACSTRRPGGGAADAAPPRAAAIEVRGGRGELAFALVPLARGFELRLPGRAPGRVVPSATGAVVTDAAGAKLAELAPGPGGSQLTVAGGPAMRVTFPRPHFSEVISAEGVLVLGVEILPGGEAVGRDAGSRVVLTGHRESDRVRLEGAGALNAGSVRNLPAGPDADLAAVVLGSDTIAPEARSALAAFLLSR